MKMHKGICAGLLLIIAAVVLADWDFGGEGYVDGGTNPSDMSDYDVEDVLSGFDTSGFTNNHYVIIVNTTTGHYATYSWSSGSGWSFAGNGDGYHGGGGFNPGMPGGWPTPGYGRCGMYQVCDPSNGTGV
jgi:hypothetical protein